MNEYISREAMLKNLTSDLEHHSDEGDLRTCLVMRRFIKYVEDFPAADVQPVPRWISVDDRLPEIGKSVLVIVSINAKVNLPLCTDLALEMRIGWLDDNGKWGLQFDSADRDEILYWMPLPEPPKDGDIE